MSETCDGRHMCEPPWPVKAGDEWDCPECGRKSYARRVGDMPHVDKLMAGAMGKHLDPNAFGWVSPAERVS